jgi:dipeptidyl aminopeptidase/acylaminoacyl peptidase
MAFHRVFVVAVALHSLLPAQQAKRPLSHKDYDSWRTISSQVLSRDGKWLAYAYMPQEEDGELVIRNLSTGKEYRQPAGALPPAPVLIPGEQNPEAEPPRRNLTIRFTSDGAYVVSSSFPAKADTEKARKERKPEPKGGAIIVKLEDGSTTRLADVKAFQVPEKGGSWAAFHKESATTPASAGGSTTETPSANSNNDQRRGGGAGAAAGARGGATSQFGSDLILRHLAVGESADKTFPNATEFNFLRDGKLLVYAVGSRKSEENGVFAATPGADGTVKILAGKGRFSKLAWDREQAQLAFVSDLTPNPAAAGQASKYAVYHWLRGAAAEAAVAVANRLDGMPDGMSIVERGAIAFSRDGKKLYVPVGRPTAPPQTPPAATADENKVQLDMWHWRDDVVQPMQRIRANTERARTFRGVYHLAERKYVQAADETIPDLILTDSGKLAIGGDNRAYRRMTDYDGSYSDYYLLDTATGARQLIAKQLRGGGGGFGAGVMQWSPDGKFALFYSAGNWHIVNASDATTRNVTEGLSVSFADEEDDTPDPAGSYQTAGWARDSQSAIVYDRYDLWQVFADRSQSPKNLTNGRGRREKLQFRVQRVDPVDEEDSERGLDLSAPLTLRAVSEETRATGFFRLTKNSLDQLLWGPKAYSVAGRAKDADVMLITAARFDEFPDLQVTNTNFAAPKKVTDGAAQVAKVLWGTAETIRFRNSDGVSLKGTLFKPENFDPKRKYPMIVYIYEKLSQGLHNFVHPTPGTSINIAYYVSNGYLILTPDIVYTAGYPGQSALKCVLPAIDAVVEKGFVNENAIGIQGHSWGGYQIAYMVTQTNRFKAAEAGAPVGNMTSAYSGIRWGTGMPRQFQYEQTQSRIGTPLYKNPQKYMENSPVFYAERVKTPLLLLHNDQDDAVPWYQGIELYLALRRNEKEAYLFNYNGEFHGLRRRHNQKDWTVRMQQFFDFHLKDAVKPEWMQKGIPYLERDEEKQRFQNQ